MINKQSLNPNLKATNEIEGLPNKYRESTNALTNSVGVVTDLMDLYNNI